MIYVIHFILICMLYIYERHPILDFLFFGDCHGFCVNKCTVPLISWGVFYSQILSYNLSYCFYSQVHWHQPWQVQYGCQKPDYSLTTGVCLTFYSPMQHPDSSHVNKLYTFCCIHLEKQEANIQCYESRIISYILFFCIDFQFSGIDRKK